MSATRDFLLNLSDTDRRTLDQLVVARVEEPPTEPELIKDLFRAVHGDLAEVEVLEEEMVDDFEGGA